MSKQKSPNVGLYLPEYHTLAKIAKVESGRQKKVLEAGTLIRQILKKSIEIWKKKNPTIPLDDIATS